MNSMENWEVMQQISAADTPAGQDYALRRCSFDPKSHLINLESDSNKKARLYLTVEWRVYWFQTWCQENGKSYLIEESPVESIQGTSFIQSRCTVYIDGEAAGHGIGGINLSGSKGGDYCIQSCATIAKGRALANAGFGSVFSSALDSENGADIPCDGGMGTDFFVFSPQWLGPKADNQPPISPQTAQEVIPMGQMMPASAAMPCSPGLPQAFPGRTARQATAAPETGNAPKIANRPAHFL